MPSLLPDYEYDIFISYRHNDNRTGWVTEFVKNLQEELAAAIKEPVSVYFDSNPHDGLLETHNVHRSLERKLKCLIIIPILSRTYCDTKSFAWQHEFLAFHQMATQDAFGKDVKLRNGNVASRILPLRIHEIDEEDKVLFEKESGGRLRPIDFIYKESGVNRPLIPGDKPETNLNRSSYRNQINKTANAIHEIISALRSTETAVIEKQIRVQPPQISIFSRYKIAFIMTALIAVLSIGYFLYSKSVGMAVSQSEDPKSIAVMPFVNMSNDPDQEYFSDGISEELLNMLGKVPSLKVVGRSSSFSFKGKNEDAKVIGQKLGATHLLEGSVRKDGNRIRIIAHLTRVADATNLWSETYDREMENIFDMQEEIAAAVVGELKLRLFDHQITAKRSSPEVYNLILMANHLNDRRSEEDVKKAIEIYRQALAIDSLDAMAWAYLSSAYLTQATERYELPEEAFPKAIKTSMHAIRLDDKCAQAHQSLGVLKIFYEWDWEGARKELTRALELDPANNSALRNLGILHGVFDDPECFSLLNKSISRDPMSPVTYVNLILFQINAAKLDEARKTLETYKNVVSGTWAESPYYFYAALIHIFQNQPDVALEVIASGPADKRNNREFIRALAYHLSGDTKLSGENLQQFIAGQPRAGGAVAKLYAFRNEKDLAFEWINRAIQGKHFGLLDIITTPLFDNIRTDPRYNDALKTMNLHSD